MATTDPNAPAVSFQAAISGGFTAGRKIAINGTVHENTDEFRVDLCAGSDIALHYNQRFNEKVVVYNTRLEGNWGHEETDGCMPFQCGQDFTMEIHCQPQCFQIMVNEVEVHEYSHRYKDLDKINSLEIYGVTLAKVKV